MNSDLEPDFPARPDARASVARALAQHYTELAGLDAPDAPAFSLARMFNSAALRRAQTGREREITGAAATLAGQEYEPNRLWVPLAALGRSMGAFPGSKGGYSVGADVLTAADVLRPWSVTAQAGMQILSGLSGNVSVPRVTTSTTATWLAEGEAPADETPPVLGEVSMTPRTAIATIKFSAQLLRQSEHAEQLIRDQLLRAAGALLDAAVLNGAGGAEPLGLRLTPGIGTGSGANLAHAGVVAQRAQLIAAGAREDRITWIATGAVQALLAVREFAAGSGRMLWDDNGILGRPAYATPLAPAATLVAGDFSTGLLGIFGPGLRIDIDPSQLFGSAGLVARVLLFADVAYPQPSAFSVATSVT